MSVPVPFIPLHKKHKPTRHFGLKMMSLGILGALVFSVAMPTIAMSAPRGLSNRDKRVTPGEVGDALRNTPGVMQASDQAKATTDADSALKVATAGATVDIPKRAADGVTMASAEGTSIDISLPNAAHAGAAKNIAAGVVAYESSNGSANAVQADEQGGVRMLTVIDNPSAPTAYAYKVSVPSGGKIILSDEGGARILDSSSKLVSLVNRPWAKDADGKIIKTWFSTNGKELIQHVAHNVAGIVYPVTADPFFVMIGWPIVTYALRKCGIGFAFGAGGTILIDGWNAWKMVAAGGIGCVERVAGGWHIIKHAFKIIRW